MAYPFQKDMHPGNPGRKPEKMAEKAASNPERSEEPEKPFEKSSRIC